MKHIQTFLSFAILCVLLAGTVSAVDIVDLISPANDTQSDEYYDIHYNMLGTPTNCTLWHNLSGSWALNRTDLYPIDNVTFSGGVVRTDGYHDGGLSFDGNADYVDIGNAHDSWWAENVTTITAWVRPRAGTPSSGVILGSRDGANGAYSMMIRGDRDLGSWCGTQVGRCASCGTLTPIDGWTHVATVFNDSHVLYYINGSLIETTTCTRTNWDPSDTVLIGHRESGGATNYFNGTIDSLRVWNVSLTAAQIIEERDSATPVNTSHLKQAYSLDNGFRNNYLGYNANLTWNVECYNETTNIWGTTNRTLELIYDNYIDDCSSYTTDALNYTIQDEVNSTVLTGDMDYTFTWNKGGNSFSYSGTNASLSSFPFCVYPTWSNFTGNINLQYSVTGYDTRDYIQSGFRIDNATNQIILYSLFAGQSTQVTLHVINDQDEDLANVTIEAYKWDIDTNTELLVETETTDSDGNAIFDIVTGTNYYSFKFYQDGQLQLTTSRFKIFSTSLEYILSDTETTRLQEWLELNSGISRTLTHENDTGLVTFTWTDSDSVAGGYCLNITYPNLTTAHHNCSSTSPMAHTLTLLNQSYIARAWARYSASSNWYILETLGIDSREGMRKWLGDDTSLAIGFFIILVVGLIALITKSMGVMGIGLAATILYFFGILPGFTTLTGIIAIGIIVLIAINRRGE